ncbi:MAG: diadenylate cyclase CdaA [Bacillota bacterium]|nr:diadenylate cyclase CdaA [Bacillota bacterium]
MVWNILRVIINVADIAIVGYAVYRLVLALKNTRAMQVVKGVLLLFFSYLASGWLHLDAVHWILGKSWSVIIVGIAIIFQPELRGILEKLGRGHRFGFGTGGGDTRTAAQSRMAQDISDMLEVASRQKTGVLLVLEGNISLGAQISTGVPVDAEISKELLLNLYFKNSPLHDGAVIIRHGRVAAAGCIMPLTAKENIDSSLGTRHRAAIGISEISDALVFVVSEETGAISIVRQGKMYRRVTPKKIGAAFDAFYGIDGHEVRKNGKSTLLNHLKASHKHGTLLDKGISVLIAILLWLYVTDVASFPWGN